MRTWKTKKPFQVLKVDEDKETVEIQHLDGDIEELDVDGWAELDLELTEEPEGWSGSKAENEDEDEEEDDWDEDDEDEDDEDLDDEDDEDDTTNIETMTRGSRGGTRTGGRL
jgi:hypothetical protein